MRITVTVKSNSSKGSLVLREENGTYTVYLRAKPKDGEANIALIKTLSEHFRIPKTSISIIKGATSRHKIIELPID